jgi:hypothetical protein
VDSCAKVASFEDHSHVGAWRLNPSSSVQSFAQDNVFSDGTDHEILALTGSVANGLTAALTAVVAA